MNDAGQMIYNKTKNTHKGTDSDFTVDAESKATTIDLTGNKQWNKELTIEKDHMVDLKVDCDPAGVNKWSVDYSEEHGLYKV